MVGFGWPPAGTKQVVYVGENLHIYELWAATAGVWEWADLTTLTGSPPAESALDVRAFWWPSAGSKQVVYWAGGHCHELYVSVGNSWRHADLTQLAGAPPCLGEGIYCAFAWTAGQAKQVAYLGDDNHIHELSVSLSHPWQHADLTQLSGAAPLTVGYYEGYNFDGYAWAAGSSKQICFQELGSARIHEFSHTLGGSWTHTLATTQAPALHSLAGYQWFAVGTKQIVGIDYQTNPDDGHVHEWYATPGGAWHHADLTQLTGAPAAFSYLLSAYDWGEYKQVLHLSSTGPGLIELYVDAASGTWKHADLAALTGAPSPIGDSLSGYAWGGSTPGGAKCVVYQGADLHIHELSTTLEDPWKHTDLTAQTGAPVPWN
jgi:hypothetical protein